jgi:hypothetical protein
LVTTYPPECSDDLQADDIYGTASEGDDSGQ